jgi:hypothetical protein
MIARAGATDRVQRGAMDPYVLHGGRILQEEPGAQASLRGGAIRQLSMRRRRRLARAALSPRLLGEYRAPLFSRSFSAKSQEVGERWLKEHPNESRQLLSILTDVVIEYMSEQVKAGADLLQARRLSPDTWARTQLSLRLSVSASPSFSPFLPPHQQYSL